MSHPKPSRRWLALRVWVSTGVGRMLSGGGHVERCSGFSADLKGLQDIDRWSLWKAAPLPSCAGTLSQSRDKHPQVGSQRPARTVLSPS